MTSFPASSEGKIFFIRIVSHNIEYSTPSSIESMKLAGVPSVPASAPILVAQSVNSFEI